MPLSCGIPRRTRTTLIVERKEETCQELAQKAHKPPSVAGGSSLSLWRPAASTPLREALFPWEELNPSLPSSSTLRKSCGGRPVLGSGGSGSITVVKPDPPVRKYGKKFSLQLNQYKPTKSMDEPEAEERHTTINFSTDWLPMYSSFSPDHTYHLPPFRNPNSKKGKKKAKSPSKVFFESFSSEAALRGARSNRAQPHSHLTPSGLLSPTSPQSQSSLSPLSAIMSDLSWAASSSTPAAAAGKTTAHHRWPSSFRGSAAPAEEEDDGLWKDIIHGETRALYRNHHSTANRSLLER